jgi:hypothetical protein
VSERHRDGLVDVEPIDAVMFLGGAIDRVSLPIAHRPQGQVKVAIVHPQVRRLHELVHVHRDPDLFENLAAERLQWTLVIVDMSTGKVPDSRI